MSTNSQVELWLRDFCQEPFWENHVSWNTTSPKLSKCFRQTALTLLPCIYLWILTPLEAIFIARSRSRLIPWTFTNICRLALAMMLAAMSFVEFISVVLRDGGYFLESDFYAPLLKTATYLIMSILLLYHRLRGVVTSGVVWTFVLITLIFSAPIFYNLFVNSASFSSVEYAIYVIYTPALFVLLVLCSYADKPAEYEQAGEKSVDVDQDGKEIKPNPQDGASFPSQITYWWFTALTVTGFRQALKISDLWALREDDKTRIVGAKFEKNWLRDTPRISLTESDELSVRFSDEKARIEKDSKKKPTKQPGVLNSFTRTFGLYFLTGSMCKFVYDCLSFTNPQLLKWLIQFIESRTDPFWHGFVIVGFMFATSTLQSIFLNAYFERVTVIGLRIRTCLTSTIYRKSLVLSNSARKDTTIGEIVNLMSVDSQRFTDLMTYLNLLWSSPFQIGLAIYFLYVELGSAVFAGVLVMVLMIPINAVVASMSKKMQVRQMKQKDERVKAMSEILNGIKVIKLYAWEESFMSQILGIRKKEIRELKNIAYLGSTTIFLWTCAPFLVAMVTFAIYVLSDPANILDAQKAFVSLALFNLLRFPLTMLPNMISFMIMASVSVKRLNKYLNSPELDKYVTRNEELEAVTVENGAFAWGAATDSEADISPTLKELNLHVPKGSFLAIVGNVGSGKSSVLNALLGEMDKIEGRVNISGEQNIAYVPQQAWIQNASLKDNILFGQTFDRRKYSRVIQACALKQDIDILPGGDDTEIGEKGINLSGGQKQRVNLARACYSEADLYLMDDPLSAVDSHVAKHLFDKVLSNRGGLLKGKTRVLVTNNIALLPQVDNILVLKDGSISETGTYKVLIEKNGDFAEFVRNFSIHKDEPESPTSPTMERQASIKDERSGSLEQAPEDMIKDKLIEAEKAETGQVKMSVYGHYLKAISPPWIVIILLGFVGYQSANAGSNYWLSVWSNDKPLDVNGTLFQNTDLTNTRLLVYGLLGTLQAILVCLGSFALAKGSLDASISLHKKLLAQILRSPMAFFDTTPMGRIVNRFSKDIDTVDSTIPQTFRGWMTCLLQVVVTIIMIGLATPYFLLVILPISVVYYFVQKFYVPTSRQLKRLESVTRSPIYSHFGETLTGVGTIRAYRANQRFINESDSKVDYNQMCCFPSVMSNRWLAIRLDFCGNCIILFAALFAVFSRETIDAGLAGLSVSYALSVTQTLNWLIRMTSELETNIVSVERLLEYTESPTEADWINDDHRPSSQWPDRGEVEFKKYAARYRPGMDLVINDLTALIHPQEKIGIVGRTGAGKSTITLSLFRIIEPAGGTIIVDGIDISQIGLHDLRSKVTIIPQDPVLFSGTLRFNLDPFNVKTDDQLWKSLEHAHLKHFVKGLDLGLEHKVSEGGENLSVGQRQLICLARALLRKTKILVLDEATAAVDLETDSLIQSTIRTEFDDCTILTIAHRLNTILDSTRVMVLDKGAIVEFDDPKKLMQDKTSVFYLLAKDAGIV